MAKGFGRDEGEAVIIAQMQAWSHFWNFLCASVLCEDWPFGTPHRLQSPKLDQACPSTRPPQSVGAFSRLATGS